MPKMKIDKKSSKDKKLLKDFRELRKSMKDRIELYQRMPDDKKLLWLSKDELMKEVFEFSGKISRGKNDK